ncbi:MAG: hypothetical protein AAGG59_16710 [Bacteroidota bacterium]
MNSFRVFFFLCIPRLLFAQVEYVHNSNGGDSEFVSMTTTVNSIVLAGNTTEKFSYTASGMLLELDGKGDTLWTHKLSTEEESSVVDVVSLRGSLLVLSRENGETVVSLFNSERQVVWSYREPDIEQPVALSRVSEHEYVVMGIGRSQTAEERKDALFLLPVNFKGKAEAPVEALAGERLKLYGMVASSEGDIYVVGTQRMENGQEAFLWSFSGKGKQKREVSLTKLGFKYPFAVEIDAHGDLLIGGEAVEAVAYVAKIDPEGNVLWKQFLEGAAGNFRVYSISASDDNTFYAVGRKSKAKAFLSHFDRDGNRLGHQEFDGLGKAGFKKVVVDNDKIMAAGTTLNAKSRSSGYVIQLTDIK